MVDLPPPPPPTDGGGDALAREEEALLTTKPETPPALAEQSKQQFLKGLMEIRGVVFWAAKLFTQIAVLLLIGAVAVWWWHLIAPSYWRWLGKEEVTQLQAIISSGAVAALITALGKKLFP